MNFSDIRQEVLRIDSEVVDLKNGCLAEMAVSGENSLLFSLINILSKFQKDFASIKTALEENEVEEQEFAREEWEEQEALIENYYYEEGVKDVQKN